MSLELIPYPQLPPPTSYLSPPTYENLSPAEMLVQFIAYTSPPPRQRAIQLMDLPLEVRELIWEFSLCTERVFHVKRIITERITPQPPYRNTYVGRLLFHNEGLFRPPTATAVCSESRRIAARMGCFLLKRPGQPSHPGIWFNPRSDILYLDRNQRSALEINGGLPPPVDANGNELEAEVVRPQPLTRIPGLENVLRVGLEWRWWTKDGSRRLDDWSSEDMAPYWAHRTDLLYAHMPALKSIHYVLPLVRHQGGLPWGREPESFRHYPAALTDLPDRTIVPIESGRRPWADLRKELQKTLGSAWQVSDKSAKFGDEIVYPPEIVGEWLLRVGAPTSFEYSTIRMFVD